MKRLILCMAAAGLATWMPAHAAIDGMEAARSSTALALQWENIKGAPYLLSGPSVARSESAQFARGVHTVALSGDQDIAIHVSAHAMLRVVAEQGGPLEAPVFMVSNGSGLAVARAARPGSDGHSWLLATEADHPAVIHLRRGGTSGTAQRVALFLARFDTPRDAVTYRHQLQLPGTSVQVRQADEASAMNFVRLGAEQTMTVKVKGPDRLLLEYRIDGEQAAQTSVVALDVALGDEPVRKLRQVVPTGGAAPVRVDGAWQAGASEQVTLDIPAGEHTLRVQPSHGILLRAAVEGRDDFLLPTLNNPWRETSADRELEKLEQTHIDAGISNQWRNIGALAANSVRAEVARRPGQDGLQRAAKTLDDAFLQYRDLLPDGAGEVQARSVVLPYPASPEGGPQRRVAAADAAFAPLPQALFHAAGKEGLHFVLPDLPFPIRVRALVPQDAGAAYFEVEFDNGMRTTLASGQHALPQEALHTGTASLALVPKDDWPASLSGHADRVTSPAEAVRVASAEWTIPAHAKGMRVRVRGAGNASEVSIPLALQWAASAEYAVDDRFLAQLVRNPQVGVAGTPLQQAAWLPLERMLAAAHAQFVANVAPASRPAQQAVAGGGSAAADEETVEAAQRETDHARAIGLWQRALGASDARVRERALHGLANVLLAAGERHIAERWLRAHWIGEDAALSRAAAEQLEAMYAREGDRSMQTLFAAARAMKDRSRLSYLSMALAAEGDDDKALLAGLGSVERDHRALLQSALRARKWATFDALLAELGSEHERAFWRAQRALSQGELDAAAEQFAQSDEPQWQSALGEGRALADRLLVAGPDQAAAVTQWLQWQAKHPGARLWREEPAGLVRHGGAASVRSVALDTRTNWWKAKPKQPLVTRVVGPARIRVEARPLHSDEDSRLSGWLRVRTADQLWLQLFSQNQPAPGLAMEQGQDRPGSAVVREIELPTGLHTLSIDGGSLELLARVQVERPALQLPVLPAPAPAHFDSRAQLRGTLTPALGCQFREGCHIVADGGLRAYALGFDSMPWSGLPAPAAEQDAAAARLAAGDIEGALEATSDPKERMRLLLWLAESRPAARGKALAQGAAIAKGHSDPEIRTQWSQLSAGSGWSLLPLVDRSAGLRRVEVEPGAPESPSSRLRAALLPPLRDGETRIGTGARAGILLNERAPGALTLEIAAENLPGERALPLRVLVERNQQQVQVLELKGNEPAKLTLKIPAGEQHVAVSLPDAYANQFVRVRFASKSAAQPRATRDWQIASTGQPVQATLAGPVWVRIDRLEKGVVHSEERLLPDPVSKLVLPPQQGTAETLYRIHQLQAHPLPVNPAPIRPNPYQPQAVPEAPVAWHGQDGKPAPGKQGEDAAAPQAVHFVDAAPLGSERDHTLSARFALQSRRDVEATGGYTDGYLERYAEAGLAWRKLSIDGNRNLLADAFVREREFGSPVLGFRLRAEQDLPWSTVLPWPFTLTASLRGFAQDTSEGLGTSLTATAALSQQRVLSSTLSHRPQITLTARTMNLSRVADQRRVDTDVFSEYRKEHNRALILGDTLSWRPWRDTHVAAGISVTTNPDFKLSRVDNHQATLQWRQLIGPLVVEGGARAIRYWADKDRQRPSTRRELHLGAVAERWLAPGKRLEVRGSLRRDLDTSSTWGGVEVSWHWGPGRRLRDFSAGEQDFGAIRSWSAPAAHHRMENE
ncbi:MAG TPA: hypothetical protein VIG66_10250 [Noviherbaspirillum sp.]